MTVGELDVQTLHGPLIIIDTSARKDRNVTAQDIDSVRGRLVDGAWLLARLDHASHYDQADYAVAEAPGFTLEACERLAALIDRGQAHIAGVGADNAGVDLIANFQSMRRSCHGLLLPRNVSLIENVADLSGRSPGPGLL